MHSVCPISASLSELPSHFLTSQTSENTPEPPYPVSCSWLLQYDPHLKPIFTFLIVAIDTDGSGVIHPIISWSILTPCFFISTLLERPTQNNCIASLIQARRLLMPAVLQQPENDKSAYAKAKDQAFTYRVSSYGRVTSFLRRECMMVAVCGQ